MDQKKYKVVVVSDSHGTSNLVSEIERWNPDADLYVHCGDLEDNPALFDNWIFARGNNDFFSAGNMKEQQVIRVGEHRLLVVHSHRCSYMNREMDLVRMAQENDCDIVAARWQGAKLRRFDARRSASRGRACIRVAMGCVQGKATGSEKKIFPFLSIKKRQTFQFAVCLFFSI